MANGPIDAIKKRQTDTAMTAGAAFNANPYLQQMQNPFMGNNSGLDAGSLNANGQKPSVASASSGHGQGAGMVNNSPNGNFTRIGQPVGVSNQQDSPSATAYQRQGAGGSLFGSGFTDPAGGGDAFIKRKQLSGEQPS